ncbi:MAG: NB-ARC domain-containing protein, partial [Candidatus Hermodarchaeota archaeon]
MNNQRADFYWLQKLISKNYIVFIFGPSGTGKTTFAQYLIGNAITLNKPFFGTCVWIQCGELFSIKRLNKLFEPNPNKLKYIREKIYITPKNEICNTYEKQF